MSAPTPPNGTPVGAPESQQATDGTTFYGTVSRERFEAAAEAFPVLKYVIEEYFGSPERRGRDKEFLQRYEDIGESSAEFAGFLEDLSAAIRQYTLASTLINGLMGVELSPSEVRANLAALKDQVLQEGDYDPSPAEPDEDDADWESDPMLVNSAEKRVRSTFLMTRELPFGLRPGKRYSLVAMLGVSIAAVALGVLISLVPFIGVIGQALIVLGGVASFVLAVGILAIRSEYMKPEQTQTAHDKGDDKGGEKKESFFSRMNPFAN